MASTLDELSRKLGLSEDACRELAHVLAARSPLEPPRLLPDAEFTPTQPSGRAPGPGSTPTQPSGRAPGPGFTPTQPSGPAPLQVAGGPAPLQVAGGPAPLQVADGPAPLQAADGPAPLQTADGPAPLQAADGPAPLQAADGPAPLQTASPLDPPETSAPYTTQQAPDCEPPKHGSDPAPRLALGDRYEDLGRIARGGMGDVRRVRDRAMGRVLAMKLMPWEMLDSPRDRARFLAEARMTAALQHPGIIPVHDSGELPDGRLWFTMKEVRGRTLRAVIAELHAGRCEDSSYAPSLRRVLDAFLRVCEAVAYAHSLGVVHRDLKPDNVMIGEFGEVLVMDWGLARPLEDTTSSRRNALIPPRASDPASASEHTVLIRGRSDEAEYDSGLTQPGEVMGTLVYMPPEQARADARRLSTASDVYSLGAVLYEILAGRPPYVGNVRTVWKQLLAGPPVLLETLPGVDASAELCAVCARAMAREPEGRFPDAGALASDLRGWLDGARRREQALLIVEDARAMQPRIGALRERAGALRAQARGILDKLRPHDPASEKAAGWRLEDEAEQLEREASIEEVGWLQALRSALHAVPDLAEAHDDLAAYYERRLLAAEAERDARGAARSEALLRLHDRGRRAAVLSGDGALTLVTDPPDAEVTLLRYVERDRRLVLEDPREIGPTPIHAALLHRGSYLLRLRAPGFEEALYPVHIAHGEHWDGVRPGAGGPHPLRLLRESELDPDSVYVPAGWFLSGGDPDAGESLPRRRLWADALVVQRHPVTNAEYLAFLNALLASGREVEALAACPRAKLGRTEPGVDSLFFSRGEGGQFCLVEPAARDALRWPVAFVSWRSATHYARWLAESTGKPWRLLNELEWEKAARGVDGRLLPWGDHVEPTWACVLGSHPGVPGRVSVDAYPLDVSPYGVRGMAGNVRDLCVNVWRPEGPLVEGNVLRIDPADEDDPELRAARGGAWMSAGSMCRAAGRFATQPGLPFGGVGFRLARSLEG